MVTYLAEFMALTRGHLACGDKGGRAGEGTHARSAARRASSAALLQALRAGDGETSLVAVVAEHIQAAGWRVVSTVASGLFATSAPYGETAAVLVVLPLCLRP